MSFDVIIVGAGIAGLTSAAYLTQAGYKTLLIEKDESCGGLLGAYEVHGHIIDKGARGIIDSGIVFPMLKQLGLKLDFEPNPIQIIMQDEVIQLKDESSLDEYALALKKIYPENTQDIDEIMIDIKKTMGYMDVLYGIENPLFLPQPFELDYLKDTLLPWMFKFINNIRKAMKMMEPIHDYLAKKTKNEALISMISQHFFEDTPTFFALSYFTLYLQYHYPKGSTQSLVNLLTHYIQDHQGEVLTSTEVIELNPESRTLKTLHHSYTYQELIWAADTNVMYKVINYDALKSASLKKKLETKKKYYASLKGADSILSLVILTKEEPQRYAQKPGPHSFVTFKKEGLSELKLSQIQDSKGNFIDDIDQIFAWVHQIMVNNTYEISIPSLRDASLSPAHETGLIISTLFDYRLMKHIADVGQYEVFKEKMTQWIIDTLDTSLWPGFKNSLIKTILSTPLTIEKRTHATQGSVTGWSFSNHPFPVEYQFLKVSQSVKTALPHVFQAGQWAFNPAGVPVAILTGKLAADAVSKKLKKNT